MVEKPDLSRKINVAHPGAAAYMVVLLDARVINFRSFSRFWHVRQFILGHHETPLLKKAKKYIGWQGEETIREFRLYEDEDGEQIREIDISKKRLNFIKTS